MGILGYLALHVTKQHKKHNAIPQKHLITNFHSEPLFSTCTCIEINRMDAYGS